MMKISLSFSHVNYDYHHSVSGYNRLFFSSAVTMPEYKTIVWK